MGKIARKSQLELRNFQVRAFNAPWYRAIEFLLLATSAVRDEPFVALPVEFIPRAQLSLQPDEPTFRLDQEAAQTLMDDLWACGLRPTEGAGSAGALSATKSHLEDMRKIAFDLLGKSST